jgi:1-deoxy-D-xylulose-5-phosphate synthase
MLKGMARGGTLFEELGFSYVGPIDGHDMDQLLPVLRTVKARATGPVLIHVLTKKGKGYAPAEGAPTRAMRGQVRRGDGRAGQGEIERAQLYQGLRQSLIAEAERDDKIVAITAAMPDGTGLDLFAERFPRGCLTWALPNSTR